jgi:Leucine-rich repeat (LRR) protein
MANASTKRIAASNEQALRNLQLGLLIVNVCPPHLPDTRGVLMNSLEHGYTIPNLLNIQTTILPSDIPIHPLPPIDLCVNLRMEMVRYYRNAEPTGRGYQGWG